MAKNAHFNELENSCFRYLENTNERYQFDASSANESLQGLVRAFKDGQQDGQKDDINKAFSAFFEVLGISICVFTYFDYQYKKEVQQFFSDATGNEDPQANYMIPYQVHGFYEPNTTGEKGREDFDQRKTAVDCLYYISRKNQDVFVEDRKPEYYVWTKAHYENFDKQCEDKLWKEYGVSYVPYGECLAFQLMWRYLLNNISSQVSIKKDGFFASFSGKRDAPPVEYDLAEMIYSSPSEIDRSQQREALRSLVFAVDGQASDSGALQQPSWKRDVSNLFFDLNAKEGSLNIFALVQYCSHLFGPVVQEKYDLSKDIETLSKQLETLSKNLIARHLSDEESTEPFDDGLISKYLEKIHKKATFPIPAYYYWNAQSKHYRTHITFPVWTRLETKGYPVNIAVCLSDIRPLGNSLDYTVLNEGDHVLQRDDIDESRRLLNIVRLLRKIAGPQVDAYYYNQVDRPSIIKQVNDRSAHDSSALSKMVGQAFDLVFSPEKPELPMTDVEHLGIEKIVNDYNALLASKNLAQDLAGKLALRLTGLLALSEIPAGANILDLLRKEDTYPSSFGCKSLKQLLQESWEYTVLRALLTPSTRELATKIIMNQNSTVDDFVNSWLAPVRDIDAEIITGISYTPESAHIDPIVPASKKTGHPLIYGYKLLFCEIFENFFKHELVQSVSEESRNPSIEIDLQRSQSEPASNQYNYRKYNLTITLAPAEEAAGFLEERSVDGIHGLSTIRDAVERLGMECEKKEITVKPPDSEEFCLEMPFWSLGENGQIRWVFGNIWLREGRRA